MGEKKFRHPLSLCPSSFCPLGSSGDKHYYRVHTPLFLIELDDTQDSANHIHLVWRGFSGDFGGNLLKAHYETSHRSETA